MKLRAMYCRVEVMKSQRAGMANKNLFIFIYFPFDLASSMSILNFSGFLVFSAKYAMRAKNSPKNIVVACM